MRCGSYQHSETRRPSDRDRIVTTGPSRFQPARPEVLHWRLCRCRLRDPEKGCRTTVAEPIAGNAGGTALYRGSGRPLKTTTRPPEADLFTITAVAVRRFIEAVPPQ